MGELDLEFLDLTKTNCCLIRPILIQCSNEIINSDKIYVGVIGSLGAGTKSCNHPPVSRTTLSYIKTP